MDTTQVSATSDTELLGMASIDQTENPVEKFTAYQISEPVEVGGYIFPSQSVKLIDGNGLVKFLTEADFNASYCRVPGSDGAVVVRHGDVAAAILQHREHNMTYGTAQGIDSRTPRKVTGSAVLSPNYDKNSDTLPATANKAAPAPRPVPAVHPTRAAALKAIEAGQTAAGVKVAPFTPATTTSNDASNRVTAKPVATDTVK